MKNGEFVDTYDRDRRVNREKSREKLDLEMIGLVKKKKKKVKPGYKKKYVCGQGYRVYAQGYGRNSPPPSNPDGL